MIIVNIMGGLGNQMFQYAAARHLSILNHTDLRIDSTNFDGHTPNKEHTLQIDRYRIAAPEATAEEKGRFLKTNTLLDLVLFEEKNVSIKLPIKVDLKVTEAPPSIKGNTAQGGTKVVKLETGAEINAPLFVNEGDTIRINTETGEYVERV